MALLNKYEIEFGKAINVALSIIQYTFRKSDKSTEAAMGKLTAMSASIGRNVLAIKEYMPVFWEAIQVGDLLLESFYQNEYIKIYRTPTEVQIEWDKDERSEEEKGKRPMSRAPYLVEAGRRWEEIGKLPQKIVRDLLSQSPLEKINKITDLFQANNRPVIKHWRYENRKEFREHLQEPFVKAIDKLQSVEWTVDEDILSVIEANENKFMNKYIEVHDKDGEVFEYSIFGDNEELKDKQLYLKGVEFNPDHGNKALEKKYYSEMRRLTNKIGKNKKTDQGTREKLERIKLKYDLAARDWNSKLLLLKNRSKHDSYKLTIQYAKERVNRTFYQYLDADYRGRLYYCQPFLNYQGKDIERGILKFANKKPMTEEGLRNLFIHTANSYNESYSIDNLPDWLSTDYRPYLESEELTNISVDKMTLKDRTLWVENNVELIENTWNNKIIHEKCEKPVVFLACCKELIQYANCEGTYYTNLPVPIDGSNNGWQHLAAISKDKQAGELVGLVPVDIQRDFYVQTAKALINKMPEWFAERNIPMKHIRKGISKRGSMTRAYSAGHLAIALNMFADVYQEGFHTKYNITMNDCNNLAFNLVEAISEVCPGPLQTMMFLQKIAEYVIRTEKKDCIEWTPPSGFPVKYYSYVTEDVKARSRIEGIGQIKHVGNEPKIIQGKMIPSSGGFASGISPNFIHSMDASHMAIVIANWEGDFAAVHDSFSSHASDMPDLTDLTKEVFIKMYNHKNFYDVIKYMILDDPEDFDSSDMELGNLKVKDIDQSDYFFA